MTLQEKIEKWCLDNHKDWIGLGNFREVANVKYHFVDNGYGKVKIYDKKDEEAKLNAVEWLSRTSRTLHPKFTDNGKAIEEQKIADADNLKTKDVLDIVRKIAFECDIWKDNSHFQYTRKLLMYYHVVGGNNFVNWHCNKFFPDRTVDRIRERGWSKFIQDCEEQDRAQIERLRELANTKNDTEDDIYYGSAEDLSKEDMYKIFKDS